VQHADQGEQAAGGGKVGFHFAVQPLQQHFGRFVVDAAPGHVDRLDLLRGGAADRLVIAVADREVFADRAAEAPQAEHDALQQGAGFIGNV
jgi:replicative DNA helicase